MVTSLFPCWASVIFVLHESGLVHTTETWEYCLVASRHNCCCRPHEAKRLRVQISRDIIIRQLCSHSARKVWGLHSYGARRDSNHEHHISPGRHPIAEAFNPPRKLYHGVVLRGYTELTSFYTLHVGMGGEFHACFSSLVVYRISPAARCLGEHLGHVITDWPCFPLPLSQVAIKTGVVPYAWLIVKYLLY